MPSISKGPNYLDWSKPIWTFPKSFWTYSKRRHNLYVFDRILDNNQSFWTIIGNLDHSASGEDHSLVRRNSPMNDDDKINQV